MNSNVLIIPKQGVTDYIIKFYVNDIHKKTEFSIFLPDLYPHVSDPGIIVAGRKRIQKEKGENKPVKGTDRL